MLQGDDGRDVSDLLSEAVARLREGEVTAFDAAAGADAPGLILCRIDGVAHAYANVCPHAGRRLDWAPGQFLLDRGRLVCAAHGACFALDTGLCVSGPCVGASLQRHTLG